jgi:hypothetical protein
MVFGDARGNWAGKSFIKAITLTIQNQIKTYE